MSEPQNKRLKESFHVIDSKYQKSILQPFRGILQLHPLKNAQNDPHTTKQPLKQVFSNFLAIF